MRSQSGAVAFPHPATGTYLTGTANRFIGQHAAVQAMIQFLRHPLEGSGATSVA